MLAAAVIPAIWCEPALPSLIVDGMLLALIGWVTVLALLL